MKPSILAAYEKCRKCINTMTFKSLGTSRRMITLFSRMFIYNANPKTFDKNYYYREDLLYRFQLKLDELIKNNKEGE